LIFQGEVFLIYDDLLFLFLILFFIPFHFLVYLIFGLVVYSISPVIASPLVDLAWIAVQHHRKGFSRITRCNLRHSRRLYSHLYQASWFDISAVLHSTFLNYTERAIAWARRQRSRCFTHTHCRLGTQRVSRVYIPSDICHTTRSHCTDILYIPCSSRHRRSAER